MSIDSVGRKEVPETLFVLLPLLCHAVEFVVLPQHGCHPVQALGPICHISITRLHTHSSGRDDYITLILSLYTVYKIDTQYCHAVHNEHAQRDDIPIHA